jgi:hypothetical protein
MIALVIVFLGFGLLGIVAYAAFIVAVGTVCGVFYWTWRVVRFVARLAWVLACAVVAIVRDVLRFARIIARLAWRVVRFVALAFVHVGDDLARLAR